MSSSIAIRSRAGISIVTLIVAMFGAVSFFAAPSALAAQEPVDLGAAESFAVLAGSGITNTGPTTITGDVGTFPTPSETGFGSVTLNGTNHAGDAVTQAAKNDLVTAYNDAAGRTPVTNVPVELGGSTLLAGVYTSGTFGLTGTLTLDAQDNANAQFIFQAGSTLITASNSRVLLLNGADPCNVVWKVGSSATFGTGTRFVGDVLAFTSITANTGAVFEGRLLARNGAVTLHTNTITNANCNPDSPEGETSPTPTATTGPSSNPTPSAPPSSSASPTPTDSSGGIATAEGVPGTFGPVGGPLGGPPGANTPGGDSAPPSLVVTGASILGLLGIGLGLLNIGGIARISGRRRRKVRIA